MKALLFLFFVFPFNDGKNIVGKIIRLKKEYGIFKGDKYETWVGRLIKNKTGNTTTTFFELHQLHLINNNFKDVYCTGTNIRLQKPAIFSWLRTPSMQIKYELYVDGGMINNYPVNIFDTCNDGNDPFNCDAVNITLKHWD